MIPGPHDYERSTYDIQVNTGFLLFSFKDFKFTGFLSFSLFYSKPSTKPSTVFNMQLIVSRLAQAPFKLTIDFIC